MKNAAIQDGLPHAGDHLKHAAMITSFCGLFLSLVGTFFIWAGVNAFNCPDIIWKTSLAINLFFFILTWLIYLPFRNTDQLIGKGLLAFLMLFSLFWLFGFAMLYFYFLFAPINSWVRMLALTSITTTLAYRATLITQDIKSAFKDNKILFDNIYCNNGKFFTFNKEAVGLLQKARRDRNPFKSTYLYATMLISPFTLVLNRLLSPVVGDGHGVFVVTAFFSVPILQWGVEIFVQTIMAMIYYPIKLQKETGKQVLLKDW